MSAKITFYIARHGKTLMNTLDRVQGWCDSPLTDEGIKVARCLGYGLGDIKFRSAYCSDLRRTRQTANIVLNSTDQSDISITECAGLREACFGSFECDFNERMWGNAALYLQYVSGEDMYKNILKRKLSYGQVLDVIKKLDKLDMAESFAQVEARTQETLFEIAKNETPHGDGNILVIAHGMSILCMLHNMGGDKLLNGHLENAAVCKVTYQDGKFTIHSMGDMSYVEKGRMMDKM